MNVKNANVSSLISLTRLRGLKRLHFFGVILISSIILSWTAATDDVTSQVNLQYQVYISSKDNIRTPSDAEKNGFIVAPFTSGLTSSKIDNLVKGRKYFFNAIVKDEAGNKSAYVRKQVIIRY